MPPLTDADEPLAATGGGGGALDGPLTSADMLAKGVLLAAVLPLELAPPPTPTPTPAPPPPPPPPPVLPIIAAACSDSQLRSGVPWC